MTQELKITERDRLVSVETPRARFTFDAAQGGNCVEGAWGPLDTPLLCTNYHSTDLFAAADGRGYYTTGDRDGVLTVRKSGPDCAVVVADCDMACQQPEAGLPASCGRVQRVYEINDATLTVHVRFVVGDTRELWDFGQLRMMDMETNHRELTHFATQDPKGEPVSGPVDANVCGLVRRPRFPRYTLYGHRLAVTTSFDSVTDLDCIYAENGREVKSVGVPGTALLAFWIRSQPRRLTPGTTFSGTLHIRLHPVDEGEHFAAT